MSTLTDRYVWAVVRLLPEDQRPEVDRELRSLIADMADHRTAGGTDEEADHVEAVQLVERWARTTIQPHDTGPDAPPVAAASTVGPTAPVALDARAEADATLEQPL